MGTMKNHSWLVTISTGFSQEFAPPIPVASIGYNLFIPVLGSTVSNVGQAQASGQSLQE